MTQPFNAILRTHRKLLASGFQQQIETAQFFSVKIYLFAKQSDTECEIQGGRRYILPTGSVSQKDATKTGSLELNLALPYG